MSTLDITLNGQPMQLPGGATLLDAAQASGVQPPFAAAVNLQFVPRTQYVHTLLKTGDQVELISPVTGG
jgi:sulfur carrier protein